MYSFLIWGDIKWGENICIKSHRPSFYCYFETYNNYAWIYRWKKCFKKVQVHDVWWQQNNENVCHSKELVSYLQVLDQSC